MRLRRAVAGLLGILFAAAGVLPARAQDATVAEPDPSLKPLSTTYGTSYDRDRSRALWSQSISIGSYTKHATFNAGGTVTTQDYLTSNSKSTMGSLNGMLSFNVTRRLAAILTGSYGMNSSRDGLSGLDNRDNRLNAKAQYNYIGPRGSVRADVYTEFEQKHDRGRSDGVKFSDDFDDPDRVDSTLVHRDSSYTSSRMDGVSGEYQWSPRPWLRLIGTAQGYRTHPTITSTSRTFLHARDSTSFGYVQESVERSQNPTGNTDFNQTVSFTKLRLTTINVSGQRRRLAQSYYDKQRAAQEDAEFETNAGTLHFDTAIVRRFSLYTDATLTRRLNVFTLNRNRTQLARDQKLFSSLTYADSSARATVTFQLDRSRTELNPSVSGLEVSRNLGGNGQVRTGRRLVLDAMASVSLLSNDFEKDQNDRDIQRTTLSVGGGYMLTPVCSTTVHFTRIGSHTVNLDPQVSSSNAQTTSYQMNATLQYLPNRNFSLRQSYVLSAEYRILDFAEVQNSLRRVRRIDTDVADTLLSVVIMRLTHNFVFQDQGTYARLGGNADRLYRIASRSYDQTLTATAGLKIAPGVTFLATQSLLNNRTYVLVSGTKTTQNTWKLNIGLEARRSLDGGIGIIGAVRRIEEYVEGSNIIQPRRDWVAGVSFQKVF